MELKTPKQIEMDIIIHGHPGQSSKRLVMFNEKQLEFIESTLPKNVWTIRDLTKSGNPYTTDEGTETFELKEAKLFGSEEQAQWYIDYYQCNDWAYVSKELL